MPQATPPLWLCYLTPRLLPFVWIADFILCSAALSLALKAMKKPAEEGHYARNIVKVWVFTYFGQALGTLLMLLSAGIDFVLTGTQAGAFWSSAVTNWVAFNPLGSIPALLWVLASLFASGFLIYLFITKFALVSDEYTHGAKKRIALTLVLFASPYLFLVPTVLI